MSHLRFRFDLFDGSVFISDVCDLLESLAVDRESKLHHFLVKIVGLDVADHFAVNRLRIVFETPDVEEGLDEEMNACIELRHDKVVLAALEVTFLVLNFTNSLLGFSRSVLHGDPFLHGVVMQLDICFLECLLMFGLFCLVVCQIDRSNQVFEFLSLNRSHLLGKLGHELIAK